jgi:hypothetical protein
MFDPCFEVVSGIVYNIPNFTIIFSRVMIANEPVNHDCVILGLKRRWGLGSSANLSGLKAQTRKSK